MRSAATKRAAERRFDSLEQEAFLNLWRTYDALRAIEDETFARHGLTAQQYNALRLLRGTHPEPLPTLGIAARLVSRAPDITRLLDKLDERGLIARERPAGDRRTVHVAISAAGLELLRRLDEEVRACHERQLGHLKRGELTSLIELMKACRKPHEVAGGEWS